MKTLQIWPVLGVAVLLLAGPGLGRSQAQQPAAPGTFNNFDPAQIQAQMIKLQMDRYRAQ